LLFVVVYMRIASANNYFWLLSTWTSFTILLLRNCFQLVKALYLPTCYPVTSLLTFSSEQGICFCKI